MATADAMSKHPPGHAQGEGSVALQCDDDPGSRCWFSLAWLLTFLFVDRRQGAYCSYGIVPYGTIVISPVAAAFLCLAVDKLLLVPRFVHVCE